MFGRQSAEHSAAADMEVFMSSCGRECRQVFQSSGGLGGGLCRESSKAIAGLLIQLILLGKQRKVHGEKGGRGAAFSAD